MPYLDLDDRRLFYNDTGDGPPLILLHNGFYSTDTWDPVRSQFAAHFRVIDYDRYGYGRSTQYPSQIQTPDIVAAGAAELEMVMDALSIPSAHLIGHCLGGAAVLVFAGNHPARVDQIVAASVGYYGSLKSLITSDMTFVPFERIEAILKKQMITMHGEAYAQTLWAILRAHKSSYIMNEDYDIRKTVFRIKTPLLIVNGDRDFYFEVGHPLSVFKKMRKTAELWIMPKTGHDVHMEHPDLFVSEVLRFFERNRGRGVASR